MNQTKLSKCLHPLAKIVTIFTWDYKIFICEQKTHWRKRKKDKSRVCVKYLCNLYISHVDTEEIKAFFIYSLAKRLNWGLG